MIRFRLAELMADHQFKHGRRVTVKELSDATGINRNTLSRMANTRGYSTSTDTIDKLCKFFGCDVSDVARYVDDAPTAVPATPVDGSDAGRQAAAASTNAVADSAAAPIARKRVPAPKRG